MNSYFQCSISLQRSWLRYVTYLSVLMISAQSFGSDLDTNNTRFHNVTANIERYIKKSNVPSISVAVAQKEKVVWTKSMGLANKEKQIPATPDTLYSIPIADVVTLTGLMVLVERGLIDLDKPINNYLGETKLVTHIGDASAVTVRRIANNTGGLATHFSFSYADERSEHFSMEEKIARYGHVVSKPGEVIRHSGFGMALIEYIISRVSGKTFPAFMQEEVFNPLGLKQSKIIDSPMKTGDELAERYASNGKPIPFYTFSGGNLYTSARDLVRFNQFLLNIHNKSDKPLLLSQSIDEILSLSYNNPWTVKTLAGQKTLSQSGTLAGAIGSVTLIPEQGASVVVLANASRFVAPNLGMELSTNLVKTLNRSESERKVFSADAGLPGKWLGTIHVDSYRLPIQLEVIKESVKVVIDKGEEQRLWHASLDAEGWLTLPHVQGDIGRGDTHFYSHTLNFKLKPRGDVLNGYVTAISKPIVGRLGNGQSFWVELKRAR